MAQLPSKHLGGVEFFRFPDLKSLDVQGYFDCIKILELLFKSQDFLTSTPGFYLNYITVPDDNLNSLRLTYHSTNPIKTQEAIQKFVNQNSDKIVLFNSQWTGRTKPGQPIDEVIGEELKFRNFLNHNTQIFLDLLDNYGQQPLQRLVYDYRYQHLPNRTAPEAVIGPVISQFSPYYQELKNESLDKDYWHGLMYLFHGRDFGLHFLVNMAAIHESPYDPKFFQQDWTTIS